MIADSIHAYIEDPVHNRILSKYEAIKKMSENGIKVGNPLKDCFLCEYATRAYAENIGSVECINYMWPMPVRCGYCLDLITTDRGNIMSEGFANRGCLNGYYDLYNIAIEIRDLPLAEKYARKIAELDIFA